MKEIKEITVFTSGDADDLATWSNVPYFFTRTLLSKGIKVNKVNIAPDPLRKKIYEKTIRQVAKLFNRETSHDYFRSRPHFDWVRGKIKKALKDYPDADLSIFLTFSFSSVGLTDKPTILFCDWTYDHFFKYFVNREPDFIERATLKRENQQIEGADMVFPLFPGVETYMREKYKNPRIYYLGNVVNSLLTAKEEDILQQKETSKKLLFIGSKKYYEGAKTLIDAFRKIKLNYPGLSLHIIGMTAEDFKNDGDLQDIHFYGYLDKGNEAGMQNYYQLLQQARAVINTTPKWGAFSSTIECMYFYTPVITTPYKDFTETFGKEIPFGYYCQSNEANELTGYVQQMLNLDPEQYRQKCLAAHEAVKDYSWSAYIDKLLSKVKEEL